jgi:hypothetical protein
VREVDYCFYRSEHIAFKELGGRLSCLPVHCHDRTMGTNSVDPNIRRKALCTKCLSRVRI